MDSVTAPMIVKDSQSITALILLAIVAATFGYVLYLMLRHQRRTRKARKRGRSPHTGRHGNH